MKRIIAASVSLSLILVSAPLPAWSQVSAAMSGSASGVSASAAGAAATAGIPQLSMSAMSLTAPALGGALSAPMANSPVPFANRPAPLAAASPVEVRQALAIAVPLAAAKPAAPAAPAPVRADAASLAAARADIASAAGAIAEGPVSASRSAAARMMDRLLGVEQAAELAPAVEAQPSAGAFAASLTPAAASSDRSEIAPVPSPGAPDNAPRRSKLGGALKMAATFAAGAALTIGLQLGAVALFPAIFGVVPVAAVWAVSSGLLLFPLALYARYRLAKRDSPRLDKVKTILDLSLGAFVGAVAIAVPSLGLVLTTAGVLTAATPLLAVAGGRWFGSNTLADTVLTWAVLGFTPAVVAVASTAGLIGIAPIVGLMMLPVMTTIAFFLGRLIHAAETGAPFAVPGSMQKIRFPSFQWVMIGVVFALLTGYSAVYTNIAFGVWTVLGGRSGNAVSNFKVNSVWSFLKKVMSVVTFNRLYLGLLAYTAFTGFASPLTFLVIAFAGERASVWTDKLLGRILPKAAPAPSTRTAPVEDPNKLDDAPPKWPAFHYWAKSFLMLGSMAGIGVLLSVTVFGVTSLLTNLGIASVLAFVPFFFAKKIIKLVMKAQPTTREQDPEFFEIMEGLKDKINAERRAKGKKEIPMPEMVIDPMDAPNAYATGRSPFAAMVGVTRGFKAMTLEPEIVRDGVVRLVSASDPASKEFKVFRRAIAGSLTGVPADATPAQVAAAVLKADRSELKALGVRMMRGVLSHEFAHVMDRHMLSGSIGGAIASGVAFASYGVMWAVGHAQVLVQKALGLTPKTAPEAERSSNSEGPGAKTHALDPISTGVILKSLPALLRLFAALWAPVVLQVLQMASSRNNEGMADEDGALLSEDPESLALALGLLTTWRPGAGFRLPGATIPRAASLQHIMIVNPLEQLENAGALPATSASGGPTRADDLIFELFITHPNTGVRIRKLWEMSEAMRGLREKPQPPKDGGGGGDSRVSFAPHAGPASEKIGGGLLRGAWAKLKSSLRVLPDEGRNRQYWIYIAGQALIMLGVNFHYTALPKLVAPAKEDAALLGYNRAINWGAQAAASLVTGPVVDRTSTQKVIIWTNLGRSVLMLLVPVLFFQGYLGFAAFAALIALAGFLQMASMTAGAVAFNRILAGDEAYYNRANAVSTIVMNVVGVVGPLLAGAFIATVSAHFGLLSGNALSYAVYGVLLLASAVGYGLFLKLPRDEMMAARRELSVQLKRDGVGGARFSGVTAGQVDGRRTLFVEIDGDPLSAMVPAEYAGFPIKPIARRRILNELIQGFRTIFADRFLRLYLLSTTLSVMFGDGLIFAALPRFLEDVLHAGAGSFGIFLAAAALGSGIGSGLMAFARDPEQMALAPSARVFRSELAARESLNAGTLDAAASALRGAVPAVLARYKAEWAKGAGTVSNARFGEDLVAEGARAVAVALGRTDADARTLLEETGAARDLRAWSSLRGAKLLSVAFSDSKTGMNHLERQGKWTSWIHGVGWLAYAALFFSGQLHLAAGLMLLSALLITPAMVAWSSLTTKVVAGNYPESQGKVYAAMFFYQLMFAIVGVLAIGWLMANLPTMTVLGIAAGVMIVCALIDFITPAFIFPINRKR